MCEYESLHWSYEKLDALLKNSHVGSIFSNWTKRSNASTEGLSDDFFDPNTR